MTGEILIIKFNKDLAFLTEEVALSLSQVKMEIAGKQVERIKGSAYWTVSVINHNPHEKRLFVNVLKYAPGDAPFPTNQIALKNYLLDIESISFRNIDTGGLLSTVHGTLTHTRVPAREEPVYRAEQPLYSIENNVRQPIKQIYNRPFSIPIKLVQFLDGKVRFEKKIQTLQRSIQFEIANPHIIRAYDAIKNYFEKVLNTKTIQVIPVISSIGRDIDDVYATSAEIEKIDNTIIEQVKFEWVNDLRKKETSANQQLSTLEEFLTTASNGQPIFEDEAAFINNVLERSGTKHYHHLRYLSSNQCSDLAKLMMLTKPFSFIFLVKGNKHYHIVWETLDTAEATYIWSYNSTNNELHHVLKQTHETVKLILRDGRTNYLHRKEPHFSKVIHDYSNMDFGFKIWKQEIEFIVSA